MDNARFEQLSDEEKLGCLLEFASGIFGPERVKTLYDSLSPLVRDAYGHGHDFQDPSENYWGGVWQVYRAE